MGSGGAEKVTIGAQVAEPAREYVFRVLRALGELERESGKFDEAAAERALGIYVAGVRGTPTRRTDVDRSVPARVRAGLTRRERATIAGIVRACGLPDSHAKWLRSYLHRPSAVDLLPGQRQSPGVDPRNVDAASVIGVLQHGIRPVALRLGTKTVPKQGHTAVGAVPIDPNGIPQVAPYLSADTSDLARDAAMRAGRVERRELLLIAGKLAVSPEFIVGAGYRTWIGSDLWGRHPHFQRHRREMFAPASYVVGNETPTQLALDLANRTRRILPELPIIGGVLGDQLLGLDDDARTLLGRNGPYLLELRLGAGRPIFELEATGARLTLEQLRSTSLLGDEERGWTTLASEAGGVWYGAIRGRLRGRGGGHGTDETVVAVTLRDANLLAVTNLDPTADREHVMTLMDLALGIGTGREPLHEYMSRRAQTGVLEGELEQLLPADRHRAFMNAALTSALLENE